MDWFDYLRMAKAAFTSAEWGAIIDNPALCAAAGKINSAAALDQFIRDSARFLIRRHAVSQAQTEREKYQKIIRFAFSTDEWAALSAHPALAAEAERVDALDSADAFIRRAMEHLFRQEATAAQKPAGSRSATILLRPVLLPAGAA